MSRAIFFRVSFLTLALFVPLLEGRAADLAVPGAYPTIQDAMAASSSGDRILLAAGTYPENLVLPIYSIEIVADSGPAIIDGGGTGDVLRGFLASTSTLTLRGITITGSLDDGNTSTAGYGLHVTGGTLHLDDVTVIDNDFGVWMAGGQDHLVENCTFDGQQRHGIRFQGPVGDITVRDTLFTRNHAFSGGGGLAILAPVNSYSSDAVVERCEFDLNESAAYGAGAYFEGLDEVLLSQCLFSHNDTGFGGALVIAPCNDFRAVDCRFFGNSAVQGGGALIDLGSHAGALVTFDRCLFVDNIVTETGGAISASVNTGQIALNRCTIANTISNGTTAVRANNHHVLVENSIVFGNSPGSPFSALAGSVTVRYSDIEGGYAGEANIDLDPLFTDPANGFQYSLQAGSPCIDAGDPAHPLDPDGSVVDMGAIPFDTSPGSGSGLALMGPRFVRGDVNADGQLDIADPVELIEYLFLEGLVECEDRGDTNDDGALDIADPVRLLGYLFSGAAAPAAPFPGCWWDGTVDGLGCDEPGQCPE